MAPQEDDGCLKIHLTIAAKWFCRKIFSKRMNNQVREYLFPPRMRLQELQKAPHLLEMVIEKMDFDSQCALLCSSKLGRKAVESFGNEIERISLTSENRTFGLRLYRTFKERGSYFVKEIVHGSRASQDSRLRRGDEIMLVNGKKAASRDYEELVDLFKSKRTCVLIVRRHKHFLYKECPEEMKNLIMEPFWRERKEATEFEIKLTKGDGPFGMVIWTAEHDDDGFITSAHFVMTVVPNRPATGRLKVGDQILAVNGTKLDGIPRHEIIELFKNLTEVKLLIERRG